VWEECCTCEVVKSIVVLSSSSFLVGRTALFRVRIRFIVSSSFFSAFFVGLVGMRNYKFARCSMISRCDQRTYPTAAPSPSPGPLSDRWVTFDQLLQRHSTYWPALVVDVEGEKLRRTEGPFVPWELQVGSPWSLSTFHSTSTPFATTSLLLAPSPLLYHLAG
jgi:hypothetical protein